MPLSYTEAKALVNSEDKAYWLAQNANQIDCKVLGLDDTRKTAKVSIQFNDADETLVLVRELENGEVESVDKTRWLLDPMCLPMMLTEPKPERKRRTRKAK